MSRGSARLIMRAARLLLGGVIGGLICAGIILVRQQEQLILPSLNMHYAAEQVPAGVEAYFLPAAEGARLWTWEIAPDNPAVSTRRAAILFHGNGNTLRNMGRIHRYFTGLGYTVFTADYRGTGASSGFPTEELLRSDAELLWKHVAAKGFSALGTAVVGLSFGTGPASYLAGKYAPRAAVLYSPYVSLNGVLRDRGLLSLLEPFLRISLPSEEFLAAGVPECIIVSHGRRDETIRASHSERLLARLKDSPARLFPFFVDKAGHEIFWHVTDMVAGALGECFADGAGDGS